MMKIEGNTVICETDEDKQNLYDSIITTMFSDLHSVEIGHFASDFFQERANKLSDTAMIIREKWNVIH